jgi:signal transduction histidine kinase
MSTSSPRLTRVPSGRLLGGVCTGLARRYRLDVGALRFAFLALSVAGGIGLAAYVVLWLVLPGSDPAAPEPAAGAEAVRTSDTVAVVLLTLGALLVLRELGIWFSDVIGVVGLVAAAGLSMVWGRADRRGALGTGRSDALRLAAGVALLVVGFVLFVALTGDLAALGQSLAAAALAVLGVAVIAWPRLVRLADELRAERRARVRSEERAEIAAHLHDGVLQTLAIIQKRAGDNREVVALARRQERELREWLYGNAAPADTSLAGALAAELGVVEDDHGVRVEVVCVGDAPLDDGLRALVAATREAAANAARHAHVNQVDVFVEVGDDEVEAFVRDRGVGFDPATVPNGRRGLADSIQGRIERAGGKATVRSRPGEGTEVRLTLPRRSS